VSGRDIPFREPSPSVRHRWLPDPVGAPLTAGFAYALVVFAIGCALGTIRILLIAPRFGAAIAVLAEAPFILAASWCVSRKCIAQFRVSARVTARILMGSVALGALVSAEMELATVAFGQLPIEYARGLWSLLSRSCNNSLLRAKMPPLTNDGPVLPRQRRSWHHREDSTA